ncbi:MAG: SDR family oxidoreductase [Blastopirellula sp.]|nr:SDR family oxidoreductase [Blastopirellula sp.]
MITKRKTALITGASSGIGKELAANFARDGHDVILVARSEEKLRLLADELQAQYGVMATPIVADLESDDGAAELFKEVKTRGLSINTLANNAGYGSFGEFRESDLQRELAMMRLNMNTVVILTKLFLPEIIAARGKIMKKAFVLSFSEALASELEGAGVTVTAFCPGPTASGFQDKASMHDSALVKNKKLPTAEDVAAGGYRAMQRGQRVYIPGIINWLMAQSVRFTPRNLVTRISKSFSKPV